MADRPTGRQRNITGQGSGAYRRGGGLGTGPVGSGTGHHGTGGGSHYSGGPRGGGSLKMKLIIIVILVLLGGGGGLGGLLGIFGGSDASYSGGSSSYSTSSTSGTASSAVSAVSSALSSGMLNSLLGGTTTFQSATTSSTWADESANAKRGVLDENVASGARSKYTSIKGNGKDQVTILVYMCGTDLESKSGMATNDLKEMANATLSDQVNVIVYTGGCNSWKLSGISSSVNQIFRVKSGSMDCLVADDGKKPMTDPDTLSGFIRWGVSNYPADRYELIFWDHGGGSVSGYGYDEKFSGSGAMDLAEISKALSDGGVKFDFIGFDACLMATLENALMLDAYGDYLIASEETEPGVGWYYTNWLTALSANTSMSTLEIGKQIVDDFVDVCAKTCPGQKTTLSVIDLAELAATVPEDFTKFAGSLSDTLEDSYQTVSDARAVTREFATSSKIDQVDLVHLALNLGTSESKALAEDVKNAVKYNRTGTSMTNAYGLSIFFPQNRAAYVSKAAAVYEETGLDSEYTKAIKDYASQQMLGQQNAVSYGGGSSNALGSLLSLVSTFASTSGRSVDLADDQFDGNALVWYLGEDGSHRMSLSESQWNLVHDLEMNLFVDDGEGFLDLGLDNVYSFTEEGALIADESRAWLTVNGQFVAYYYDDTYRNGDEYRITGHIPAMLNDSRVNLIVIFDNEYPGGHIVGATSDYRRGETETVAKSETEILEGDVIDFLCDYYTYDGDYEDTYYLGDRMVVQGDLQVSDGTFGSDRLIVTYRFTDLYGQTYWSEGFEE